MDQSGQGSTFSDYIAAELPYLRRYARALTGSQSRGDKYTVATLEAILRDRSDFENEHSIKVNLFRCFHAIWITSGQLFVDPDDELRSRAHGLMSKLTANSREALLLRTIEEFNVDEIAAIMDTPADEVRRLIGAANEELAESVKGRVMIIEDEPIIAADITDIVTSLGHHVTGVARTHSEAVALGKEHEADLILADIQLADNSSGIEAMTFWRIRKMPKLITR